MAIQYNKELLRFNVQHDILQTTSVFIFQKQVVNYYRMQIRKINVLKLEPFLYIGLIVYKLQRV
jgi:hypothetical protein